MTRMERPNDGAPFPSACHAAQVDERALRARSRELRFDRVSVIGDHEARILDRLDLRIPLQGITVLAGPSGAGKSTLLRLCNRLEVPTSGSVLLDGVDVGQLDPLVLRRRVGMVFQRPVTFAGTVRDNLAVARPTVGDGRYRHALDEVGLDAVALDRAAADLSGGEAQRLCLARTMLTDPEVLLADEPTSSLDPSSRRAVEQVVRRLAASGLAVIWVTHDMDQAERLADRTRVLLAGRIASRTEADDYVAGTGSLDRDDGSEA